MALDALSISHSQWLGRACVVHPRGFARSVSEHRSLRHPSWKSRHRTNTQRQRLRLRVCNAHGSSNGTHVHIEVEEDMLVDSHADNSANIASPSTSNTHVQSSSNGTSTSGHDGHKGAATQVTNARERRHAAIEHAIHNMSSEEYRSQLLTTSGDSGDVDDESTFMNCVDEECTVEESRWWWKRALGLPKGGLLETTFVPPDEPEASQEAAAKEQRRRLRAVVLQLLITVSPLAIAWVVIHLFLTPHSSPSTFSMPSASPSPSSVNNNPVSAAVAQHLSQSPMSPFYSYLAGTAGAAGTLGLAAKLGGSIGFGAASSGAVSSAVGVAGLAGTIGQSVDTTWRTLGGASVAALYWRTFVFGKTFRIVEWQLGDNEKGVSDVPDGKMKSVTIRRPGLAALKNAVATEFKLRRASEVVQLSHWVSFGGTTFYEPLTTAKEVNTLPDNAWLVFARVSESITPIPRRSSNSKQQSSSKTAVGQDQLQVEGLLTLLAELHVEQEMLDANHTQPARRDVNGAEKAFDTLLNATATAVLSSTALAPPPEAKDAHWMSDTEEDQLVSLALAADARLLALYRAFGDRSRQRFLRHALNYAKTLHKRD
eukprot:jgi/Chlat1/6868/Chrsp51S06543